MNQSTSPIKFRQHDFRALLQAMPLAVVQMDTSGIVHYWNQPAEEMFGWSADEVIGGPLPYVTPDQRQEFMTLRQRILAGESILDLEVRRQKRNGQSIDLSISVAPIYDGDSQIVGIIGIIKDITTEKRNERESIATQARLKGLLAEAEQSRRALLSLVEDQQQAETALKERLKELSCLYAIRRDMTLGLTPDQLCQRIVDHLVQAMQFPEIAIPLLELDGKRYTIEPYADGHDDPSLYYHGLGVEIVAKNQVRGRLQVFYSEDKPFILPEEQEMLNAIAEALQLWLEHQQAEVARLRSERLLNETQALSRMGGWEYDFLTKKLAWTDGIRSILGVDEGVDLSDPATALAFCSVQEQQRLLDAYNTAVSTNQPYEIEAYLTDAQGQHKWVQMTGKPVSENGRIVKMVGNIMDITERRQHKREQEAIITVSSALRQAQTRADMLPIILDQLFTLLNANGTALAIYDPQTDHAVIEEAYGELGNGRNMRLPTQGSISGQVMQSGQPYVTADIKNDPNLHRSSLLGNVRAAVCVPLIAQEKPIGVIWVGRQHPFKQAELDILTAIANMAANAIYRITLQEQTLSQAEQIVQIMNGVPDGVLLLDEHYKIVLVNPAARTYLSLLTAAQVGHTLTHLGRHPLDQLLTSPPVGSWHTIKVENRQFETIARPLTSGPSGTGWVMVLRDVTEQRMAQQQLQQQERLAAIGQLAAGIAHDFNNLMAVIILYSQLVSRSPGLTERDQERLKTINKQADHAVRMIQQILDFSRRSVLERQTLDLRPLLKEQVQLLQRTLPEHIEIVWQSESEEYLVEADPTRIQQAVMNLAVNARDAMPDGGQLSLRLDHLLITGKQSVPVQGMTRGNWVRLTIVDTGIGIASEHLDHLFEPFFTTKLPDKGTGLGLAQVHGIVAQHGGHITVTSQLAVGTTVTIYLPALLTKPDLTSGEDELALPQGHGELILVVEDDSTLRVALKDYLQMWGYQVLEAANGQEGLLVVQQQRERVSLIVSDVVMPRMGGINLFRALQQQGTHIPIIFLTGHPLDEEMMAVLRAEGLQAWLPKPPDLGQLAQVIASVLAKNKPG